MRILADNMMFTGGNHARKKSSNSSSQKRYGSSQQERARTSYQDVQDNMRRGLLTLLLSILPAIVLSTDNIREDQVGFSDRLEVAHLYNGQYPSGIAVSPTGRKFSTFPAAFDELNTNNGSNGVFQVGELIGFDAESAYPSLDYNSPPGGCVDFTGSFPKSKGLSDYLLSVTQVAFDDQGILYILDSGRCVYNRVLLDASPGGTKLVTVDINTNSIIRTYTFPSEVATPISLFLDVAIDTQRNVAYIADSSPEQVNAIIFLDLATGNSQRFLSRSQFVTTIPGTLPFVYGAPVYQVQTSSSGQIVGFDFISNGIDGIALSPDNELLYYSVGATRQLYSLPTSLIRDNETSSNVASGVRQLGEGGFTSTIACDDDGYVYRGNGEQDGIAVYNATSGFTILLFQDKRINFIGRLDDANGYLWFTSTQYIRRPLSYQGEGQIGEDRRQQPTVLFKGPLFGNAS